MNFYNSILIVWFVYKILVSLLLSSRESDDILRDVEDRGTGKSGQCSISLLSEIILGIQHLHCFCYCSLLILLNKNNIPHD